MKKANKSVVIFLIVIALLSLTNVLNIIVGLLIIFFGIKMLVKKIKQSSHMA